MAVIVIAVGLTGAIPGSIGRMMSFGGHSTHAAASASPAARTESPQQSLDGTGSAGPTPSAAVTGNASVSPSATTTSDTLCRELYESFDPSRQRNPTGRALFQQLSKLAGGPDQVFIYCFRILGPSWFKAQRPYPAFPHGGYPGGPGDRGGDYRGTASNTGIGSVGADENTVPGTRVPWTRSRAPGQVPALGRLPAPGQARAPASTSARAPTPARAGDS